MGIQKAIAATVGVALLLSPKAVAEELDIRKELYCLATNIYFESRNQPQVGRVAVGQVTMNRVNSPKFPNTVCEVVKQARYYPSGGIDLHSCQFSWYCDGKSDIPKNEKAWKKAQDYAYLVLYNRIAIDVTEGATHYHATYVKPKWRFDRGMNHIGRIGAHIFYRWD